MRDVEVLIIGAGLAGLACGRRLAQCDVAFQILEASDAVGGRVRTDIVDGFRLDRGLQSYQTAYPEGLRVLDLDALDFQRFSRQLMIRHNGRFHRLASPLDSISGAVCTILRPIGSTCDTLRLLRWKWWCDRMGSETACANAVGTDVTVLEELHSVGRFSPQMIERFFRPLCASVLLDPSLASSARLFRNYFRTFSNGYAAIPATGMQAIPDQLANGLPQNSVLLNTHVTRVSPGEVVLATGERLTARAVVVATESPTATRLLGTGINPERPASQKPATNLVAGVCDPGLVAGVCDPGLVNNPGSCGVTTFYYAATRSPIGKPMLMLNGDGRGPITFAAVLSDVAPNYAPTGQSLIAVSIVGATPPSENDVRSQLVEWFGPVVSSWRMLRSYHFEHALPEQKVAHLTPWSRPVRVETGLYVCGDHRDRGSIDGALASGFRAAQGVAEELAK